MNRKQWIGLAIVAVALVLCVALALGIYAIGRSGIERIAQGSATPTLTSGLNAGIGKPQPVDDYFQGCPPSGDGGDPVLNVLKNRIDESNWQPTTVADLLALTWPSGIEEKPHSKWSAADSQAIAEYEGTPIQIEGYFIRVQKQSPETCNCHSVDQVDFHIWIADDAGKDRPQSFVGEITPRVQIYHKAWTLAGIRNIVNSKQKVRVSGWLMMDPEHPDQIGKTRGSIWELHPIMQIETQQFGNWVPLDNGSTGIHSGAVASQTLPTIVPASTATAPAVQVPGRQDNSAVKITKVFYDGTKGSAEPDEYVEITNTGTQPVDMTGWILQSQNRRDLFKWENEVLQPGHSIDVYTNEIHPESGGFSFGSNRAIWANSGGVAELYDADKELVSRFAYGNQK